MNWDEKAEKVANALYPKDCDRDHLRRIGCMTGFNYGVASALTAMSDGEAVERLANFLFEDDNGESIDQHEQICLDVSKCHLRSDYTQFARAAITALLGED